MMKPKAILTLLTVMLSMIAGVILSATPQMLNYQGYLTDTEGQPVNDVKQMIFSIYDTEQAGIQIWSSGSVDITVENGHFSYLIGSDSGIPAACFQGSDRWLGIQILPDSEIFPRTRLSSVPYAYQSLMSDTARVGGGWTSDSGSITLCETGDYVGIGIEEPQAKLHINEDAARLRGPSIFQVSYVGETYFSVLNTGHVGVGLVSPTATFHVRGSHSSEFLVERDDETHMVINSDGDVGIGTLWPVGKLHLQSEQIIISSIPDIFQADKFIIEGTDAVMGLYSSPAGDFGSCLSMSEIDTDGLLADKWAILRETTNAPLGGGSGLRITYGNLANQANNPTFMRITKSGNFGIGTVTPNQHRLQVESAEGGGSSGSTVIVKNTNDVDGVGMVVENWSDRLTLLLAHRDTDPEGNIFRCDSYEDGYRAVFLIKNSGQVICDDRITCKELELTGGSDLAEPFEISDGKTLPEGTLVVIDEKNPGKLRLSDCAYDTRVAGIISGAGGIKPGIMLTQDNRFGGGQYVAMNGRVYCLADASYGVIKPGDLLTTSKTAGYAMRASDREKAYGAVIGKAMSGLNEGKGMVLVLVNLQ